MNYGASITEADRLAGIYAGPSDLPVQQSTRTEFVINLSRYRHAKSLDHWLLNYLVGNRHHARWDLQAER